MSVSQSIARFSRRDGETAFPLSFSQQQLWILDQLEGRGSATYIESFARRITGFIDKRALTRSLNEIIRRHEILRTSFSAVDGEPTQIVSDVVPFPLEQVDLRSAKESDRTAELERLLKRESHRPFDLSVGPLVRAHLVQLCSDDHVLLVVMHHIVMDGWSITVFEKELSALLEAYEAELESPLTELPLQYVDYARWQRKWVQGEGFERDLVYWRDRLAAPLPQLDLPVQKQRPPVQTFEGASVHFSIDELLTRHLKKLSRENFASLYISLLACFVILLYRYSGQEDILVGTPVANRSRRELESLIGYFVNTLVLRSHLDGALSFVELLSRLRDDVYKALDHQAMPFERLVAELQPDRDPGRSPITQVMFVLHNTPRTTADIPGLSVESIRLASEVAKFDLTMVVSENRNGLECTLQYNTDLFEEETIGRMAGHFQTLLKGVVTDPDASIQSFPLLTEAEREMMLVEWNDTVTRYPKDICIHELFEKLVDETPEAIAVVFQDEKVSYRELNRRANRLACELRKFGIGPERTVGICTRRSVEMIVGLLAILKADGAYVPIDPDYPPHRMAYMMQDSGVHIVLKQRGAADDLPDGPWKKLILDSGPEAYAENDSQNAVPRATSRSLAYIIYTSGSTGEPKGVCIEHQGVVQLVRENVHSSFGPEDAMLLISPLSFDSSELQIWGPLLGGGRVVVAPPEQPTIAELGACIRNFGVTKLNMSPGLFNLLVDEQLHDLRGVHQLLIGGDVLSPTHIQTVLDALPDTLMTNVYGPTECSISATCHHMSTGYRVGSSVSIGRPISNARAYVLDSDMNPVPIGVAGELVLGGDGVGRGYQNRAELTAERFLPDPFSGRKGARMYRTGDRCRWLENGTLEFMGRFDDQLKIRGFRIEPGEIRTVMERHDNVKECIVLGRTDAPGVTQLVAYVILETEKETNAQDLRAYVRKRLPEYMTPSTVVFLNEFPIRPNGKVDRKALPVPDPTRTESDPESTSPQTATETKLIEIWQTLLNVKQVGILDNFFELGGDSLQGMRLMARVHDAFRFEMPLRALFDEPTVKGFAELIDGQQIVNNSPPDTELAEPIPDEVE